MTAEERMAYFQGKKRRNDDRISEQKEEKRIFLFFRIKFFAAVLLFIAFLSMDYTGVAIHGVGSERIIQEVVTDFSMNDFQQFYKKFVPAP